MPMVRLLLAAALAVCASLTAAARQTFDVPMRSLDATGVAAAAADLQLQAMIGNGTLRPLRWQQDTMAPGRLHERFAQYYRGVPVFDTGIVRQIDHGGVRSVFGRTFEGIAIDTSPAVPAHEAARLAADAVGNDAAGADQPTLGVLPFEGRYVLAWRTRVHGSRSIDDVDVDAATGVVLRRRSRLHPQLGDIGLGRGVAGDLKKVAARRGAAGFEARDALRPGPIETYDFLGSPTRLAAFLRTLTLAPADLARDADNSWDDGAVVDAHVHQGLSYDYFYKRFGRRGMDDANGTVTTVVHPLGRAQAPLFDDEVVGLFVNNAFYVGGTRLLVFGDGDGRVFDYTAAALDIVAHEWTHGVTSFGSDLLYEDEPGALNESFSDIMATAVEFMFHEPGLGPQRADWVLAEDAFRLGPYLRSMSDPASAGDPDHYSLRRFIGTPIDNGGIHTNSGIPNHAFYLAVAGGRNRVSGLTVQGIGLENIERMERIFYRAFVYFLTPRATFGDARRATLAAADELYGPSSPEVQELRQAWTAVGVN